MGFLDSSKLKRHWPAPWGGPPAGDARTKSAPGVWHGGGASADMGEHTDERYYFCWNVQCNKRFNSREAMEAHMQKVHRNEIGAE